MIKTIRQIAVVGNVGFVPLACGLTATIDACDIDLVCRFNWFSHGTKSVKYAARKSYASGRGATIMMHRVILSCSGDLFVDHIDGDGLNNRRSNLRIVTRSQNSQNRKTNSNSATGIKGITQLQNGGKWMARVAVHGCRKYLGIYGCRTAAMIAYERESLKLHGEFKRMSGFR